MATQEIKGFPLYRIDLETGDIFNWRGTKINVSHKKSFMIRQGNTYRRVTYNRLLYAVQIGVDYDSISSQYFVTKEGIVEKCDMLKWAHKARQDAAANRMDYIRRKKKEIQIMESVYRTGNIHKAIAYVESQKPFLVKKYMLRYGVSFSKADSLFAEASLILYNRIGSSKNTVTEMTMTLFGLMGKVNKKRRQVLSIDGDEKLCRNTDLY